MTEERPTMNIEPYEKDLTVTIEPADRVRRTEKLAFEQPLVFELIAERESIEDAGWEKAKADHKSAVAGFVHERKKLIADMGAEARKLKAGEEEKSVRVEDRIEVGPGNIDQVVTYRLDRDPPEIVGRPRVADKSEVKAWRKAKGIEDTPSRAPASKTTEPEPPAPGNGHEPEGVAAALDRELAIVCRTAHNEAFVRKALERKVPASTPADRQACIERALAAKHIGEANGKLLWAPLEPVKPADDGIVPDDYQPGATPTH
jgi:hypothetical protein